MPLGLLQYLPIVSIQYWIERVVQWTAVHSDDDDVGRAVVRRMPSSLKALFPHACLYIGAPL